eukprot:CAMPEP_0113948448 /NCGR_PEP_ID=MMETSP1339-20121228/70337_1 /TAXON_ID=94617 /ORGANISM="Fibrocapsa japonica" /LENGTH=51 /DNA_ID=CAMNT_0000955513 /DNA_START=23 /DNA_END=178 /DNA_ORIENTATION=+ /assembly_acc=CAM_ASM_000762
MELIKLLLEYNANTAMKDYANWTPVTIARSQKQAKALQVLEAATQTSAPSS